MSSSRKLMAEVDRVLKRVVEGIVEFNETWRKVEEAGTQNLRDKYEEMLKKEIKKLQRFREQIKSWASNSDIKDKDPLLKARRDIEVEMERFKELEKRSKTKAYSKEALAGGILNVDPTEDPNYESYQWIDEVVDALKEQLIDFEEEIERVKPSRKTKKSGTADAERYEELKHWIDRHQVHISELTKCKSMLEEDELDILHIDELKETIDYYVESSQDPDFMEDEEVYESVLEMTVEELRKERGLDAEPEAKFASPLVGGNVLLSSTDATEDEKKKKASKSTSVPPAKAREKDSKNDKKSSSSVATVVQKHQANALPRVSANLGGDNVKKPAPQKSSGKQSGGNQRTTPVSAPADVSKDQSPASAFARAVESSNARRNQTGGDRAAFAQVLAGTAGSPAPTATPRGGPNRTTSVPGPTQNAVRNTNQNTPGQSASAGPSKTGPTTVNQGGQASAPNSNASTPQFPPITPQFPPITPTLTPSRPPGVGQTPVPLHPGSPIVGGPPGSAGFSARSGRPPTFGGARSSDGRSAKDYLRTLSMIDCSKQHAPRRCDVPVGGGYVPRNPTRTPPEYPQRPLSVLQQPDAFKRFDTDLLFFIFYFQQGTQQQFRAARELHERDWRYHKNFLAWFKPAPDGKVEYTKDGEVGDFMYFDYDSGQKQFKKNLELKYSDLERSLPLRPAPMRDPRGSGGGGGMGSLGGGGSGGGGGMRPLGAGPGMVMQVGGGGGGGIGGLGNMQQAPMLNGMSRGSGQSR